MITDILLGLNFISLWIVVLLLFRTKKAKENEFYSDYVKGTLTLRVFKHEYEFQAFQYVERNQILESGNLSANYQWLLFDNGVNKKWYGNWKQNKLR